MRDRSSTIILGDSGGFQVQGNSIEFRGATTTRRMMRWLERTADWSMILDFPTGGISLGNMKPHSERLIAEGHDLDGMSRANGLSRDYNACVTQTRINNDLFVGELAPGATRFLNVLQGRNEAESRFWYHAVKHYPFDGWALAGGHQKAFSLTLRRLLDMHADGLLAKCGWLHVLGVSTLEVGVLLTVVQRAIRANINPNIQISFDSASPFVSAAKNGMIVGHTLSDRLWAVHSTNVAEIENAHRNLSVSEFCELKAVSSGLANGSVGLRVAESAFGSKLQIRHICAGSKGSSDVDTEGSMILMHHNTFEWLRAHEDAHVAFYGPDPLAAPLRTKTIATMIDMVFRGYAIPGKPIGNPYDLIDECEFWLDELAA
jgi:hypothetical protein